ncbi:MAG: hypothetical protein WDN45_18905 [Caulobacteraceae bacterium]
MLPDRAQGDADRGRAGDLFRRRHYRGYPAVLVRLEAIGEAALEALLADACAMQAAAKTRRRRT